MNWLNFGLAMVMVLVGVIELWQAQKIARQIDNIPATRRQYTTATSDAICAIISLVLGIFSLVVALIIAG